MLQARSSKSPTQHAAPLGPFERRRLQPTKHQHTQRSLASTRSSTSVMRPARPLRLARRVIARPLAMVRRLEEPFILATVLPLPRHQKQRRLKAIRPPQHGGTPPGRGLQRRGDGVRIAQARADTGLKSNGLVA
eukprot:scaffold5696_cov119-Isochrysis_galbana.AAC.13